MDAMTFAAMGQASTVCSKSPNFKNETDINLTFSCPRNYIISRVFSTGLIGIDAEQIEQDEQTITDVEKTIGASSKICYLDASPLEELTYLNINVTRLTEGLES